MADTNEVLTNKIDNLGHAFDELKAEVRGRSDKTDRKLDEQTEILHRINNSAQTRLSALEKKNELFIEPTILEIKTLVKDQGHRLEILEEQSVFFGRMIGIGKWFVGLSGLLSIDRLIDIISKLSGK